MDCMLLKSHLWTDPDFLRLSRVGRLAYIELSRLCDDNWGHCCFKNLHALVMALCPDEAEEAAYGSPQAQATLAEVRAQIELAVEIGLLIGEETVDGYAVGYAGWEKYTGKARRRRGKPRFAMGPGLAASRAWDKSKVSDRTFESAAFHDYATRLGLLSIIESSRSTTSIKVVERNAEVVDKPTDRMETEGGVVDYIRVPGSGFRVPGGERSSARNESVGKSTSNDWPPPRLKLEGEAARVVEEVSQRHHGQVYDHNLRKELPLTAEAFVELTACASFAEWIVACAVEAAAENTGKFVRDEFRYALRDFRRPKTASLREARRMLGLEATPLWPTGDATPIVVKVCPRCGWEDATGKERFCGECMSDLSPKETLEATPGHPAVDLRASEASLAQSDDLE